MLYTVTLTNGNPIPTIAIRFDDSKGQFNISSSSNSDIGTYAIKIVGYFNDNGGRKEAT